MWLMRTILFTDDAQCRGNCRESDCNYAQGSSFHFTPHTDHDAGSFG